MLLRLVPAILAILLPLALLAEAPEICSVARTLSRGDSGTDVSILQQFLFGQGFFEEQPTGYFGAVTEAALTDFQIQKGIIAVRTDGGTYGPRTRAYVASAHCGAAAPAPRLPDIPDAYSWLPQGNATSAQTTTDDSYASVEALLRQVAELQARVAAMNSCKLGNVTMRDGETYTPTIESGNCPIETRSDASKCGRITYQCTKGKLVELVAGTTNVVGGGCRASGQSYNHGNTVTIGSRMLICRNNEWYDTRGNKACSLGDALVAQAIGC